MSIDGYQIETNGDLVKCWNCLSMVTSWVCNLDTDETLCRKCLDSLEDSEIERHYDNEQLRWN